MRDKTILWAGIVMQVFQLLGILGFSLISFIDWSPDAVIYLVGVVIFITYNIASITFIIGGLRE